MARYSSDMESHYPYRGSYARDWEAPPGGYDDEFQELRGDYDQEFRDFRGDYDQEFRKSRWARDYGDPFRDRQRGTPIRVIPGGWRARRHRQLPPSRRY